MIRKYFLVQVLVLVAVLVGLSGCATATHYQASHKGNGYSDEQLESNRYRVTFSGNSFTPRETVENYLLYRAAEITLDNDYDYFVIADRDTESKTTYYSTFDDFGGFSRFHSFHRFGFFNRKAFGFNRFGGFGTSQIRSSVRYSTFADIVLFEGSKPNDDPNAYAAKDIQEKLADSIVTKEES